MAIILRGAAGDFVLNNRGWGLVLRTAFGAGWRPRGTTPPPDWNTDPDQWPYRPWNGADYFSGRGQRVVDADSTALAEALFTIVDDLPNHDPIGHKSVRAEPVPGFPAIPILEPGVPVNAFEVFGGTNKRGFLAFIDFCRRGGFAIW